MPLGGVPGGGPGVRLRAPGRPPAPVSAAGLTLLQAGSPISCLVLLVVRCVVYFAIGNSKALCTNWECRTESNRLTPVGGGAGLEDLATPTV